MKIPCKKLRENAILPTRGTALAAGVDLYALLPDGQESAAVAPQGKYLFPTGIAVEIPEGYVGLVFARSGIATKRQLAPANCVGVIDADYRGEAGCFCRTTAPKRRPWKTASASRSSSSRRVLTLRSKKRTSSPKRSAARRASAAPARTEAEPKNRHVKKSPRILDALSKTRGRFCILSPK